MPDLNLDNWVKKNLVCDFIWTGFQNDAGSIFLFNRLLELNIFVFNIQLPLTRSIFIFQLPWLIVVWMIEFFFRVVNVRLEIQTEPSWKLGVFAFRQKESKITIKSYFRVNTPLYTAGVESQEFQCWGLAHSPLVCSSLCLSHIWRRNLELENAIRLCDYKSHLLRDVFKWLIYDWVSNRQRSMNFQ